MIHKRMIAVDAVEGGWSLAYDTKFPPMMFLSGARAEAQARALAQRLSAAGDEVQLLVRDRSHGLVGTTRYRATPFA